MTPQGFQAWLHRRGPALARWPWHRRLAARRLLARSAAARAALAEARELEAAVARATDPGTAGDALRARLQAIPAHTPQPARTDPAAGLPLRPAWYAGSAAAGLACLLVGIALGTTALAPAADNQDLAGLAYGDTYLTETLP